MSENKNSNSVLRYAGLATQWLVLLGIAVWAGLKIDERTGWKFPLFVILLPVVALGVSLWKLIKEVSKPKK